jgi:MFS family permease
VLGLSSAIGGLLSGWASEMFGRRWSLIMAGLLEIAGTVAMALSESFGVMLTGRILVGLGVGSSLMIAPLYAAELAPRRLRGALVTMIEVSINVGILLGYVVGFALSGMSTDIGWRWMLGLGAAPPFFLVVGAICMPESPRWLINHGESAEAEDILLRACDPEEADMVLTSLFQDRVLASRGVLSDVLCPPKKWRGLIAAGLGTALFQQLTGVEAAVYYTPEILRAAGVANEDDEFLANVGIGVVRRFADLPLLLAAFPSCMRSFCCLFFLLIDGACVPSAASSFY